MLKREVPRGIALLPALWCALATAQPTAEPPRNPASALELPTVEVIGTLPIPGLGVAREQVPANVQTLTDRDIDRAGTANLPALLTERLQGVHTNNVQNNPFQPDVSFRGFSVSPLLGAPQGLSVFVDGVRMNEPFGDTVNWDLIPRNAIAAMNLVPGSNPVFGLNTLGGALAIRTKTGEKYPGTAFAGHLGSHQRRAFEFEHGGRRDENAWFVAANVHRDGGWRDYSPSAVNQLFMKLSRETREYDLDLTVALADNRLDGLGFTPNHLLKERWRNIYTHSDTTWNSPALVNLQASRWLGDDWLVAGNVYHRALRSRSAMLDINQIADARFGVAPFEGGPNDASAGGTGLNQASAALNRATLNQRNTGFNLQLTRSSGNASSMTAGVSVDTAQIAYRRSYQLGSFTDDRGGITSGAQRDVVDLSGANLTRAAYVSGQYTVRPTWTLSASARYGQTRVTTADHLSPALPPPAQGLDNNYRYTRLNPALGLAHHPSPRLNLYIGANQGSRAPSPIELACADRSSPCLLPNSMASDPFLKQVVTRTVELGARGTASEQLRWSGAIYRATNYDDIFFVSANNSQGYFTNFGKTRRQGFESSLNGRIGAIDWNAGYSLVDATFQSEALLVSPNNSSRGTAVAALNDEIQVARGNRLPNVPRHQLKLVTDWRASPTLSFGAVLNSFSRQYVRGNENNAHQAGTFTDKFGSSRTFHGSGTVPGYIVLNLRAGLVLGRGWSLFADLNNVLDKRYASAGTLGESAFPNGRFVADSDAWRRETFYSPGAPRSIFVGVRFTDRPAKP